MRGKDDKKRTFWKKCVSSQSTTPEPQKCSTSSKNTSISFENMSFLKMSPPGCFQVVHRCAQNLKELIMRADPYTVKPQSVGCYNKCGQCDSCKNFVSGQAKIKVFATGRTFLLRKVLDCETPYIVYAAECLKCGEQGVGSTVKWKPRLGNYKSHIKRTRKTCRIANIL